MSKIKILLFLLLVGVAYSCNKKTYGCTIPCNNGLKSVRYAFIAYADSTNKITFSKYLVDTTYQKDCNKYFEQFKQSIRKP